MMESITPLQAMRDLAKSLAPWRDDPAIIKKLDPRRFKSLPD